MKIGFDERILYPAGSIGLLPSSNLSSTLRSSTLRLRLEGLGLEEKGSGPEGEELLFKPEEFLADRVRGAVEKLSPMQREFITSYYFEGRSYTQVAMLLGITVKKAERLHQKAKSRLRRLLIPLLHGSTLRPLNKFGVVSEVEPQAQGKQAHHKEDFENAET
jgi:hypothetical protein